MLSAAQAQPVVVHAHELVAHTRDLPPAHVRLLGWILEQEGIGIVEHTEDPASPWNVEIGFSIRAYRSIESVADYHRVRHPERD